MADITYIEEGLFTTFCSASTAGDTLMREFMTQNGGSPKVLTVIAKITIQQMRAAGYSVCKAKPATKKEIDALYQELNDLGF